jgi:hypothetical protein
MRGPPTTPGAIPGGTDIRMAPAGKPGKATEAAVGETDGCAKRIIPGMGMLPGGPGSAGAGDGRPGTGDITGTGDGICFGDGICMAFTGKPEGEMAIGTGLNIRIVLGFGPGLATCTKEGLGA